MAYITRAMSILFVLYTMVDLHSNNLYYSATPVHNRVFIRIMTKNNLYWLTAEIHYSCSSLGFPAPAPSILAGGNMIAWHRPQMSNVGA